MGVMYLRTSLSLLIMHNPGNQDNNVTGMILILSSEAVQHESKMHLEIT